MIGERPTTPCIVRKHTKRYPQRVVAGKMCRVHRLLYEERHGPIPTGAVVCHACDNVRCENADHLWLGSSQIDNLEDAKAKGRTRVLPGERNQSAVLSLVDIPRIRRLHAEDGLSFTAIGRLFGVTRHSISNVIRGRTWGHVSNPADRRG